MAFQFGQRAIRLLTPGGLFLALGCGSSESNKSGATSTATSAATGAATTQGGTSGAGTTITTAMGGAVASGVNGSGGATASATGSGTGGGGPENATEAYACVQYLKGYCDDLQRCSSAPGIYPDCLLTFAPDCPDMMFSPGSTRTVEGTLECAQAWYTIDCSVYAPECATPGTGQEGEPCISNFQCADGCLTVEDGCSECAAGARGGEPCDQVYGPLCERGFSCDGSPGTCVDHTSRGFVNVAPGAECNPGTSNCYPNQCAEDAQGVFRCVPFPGLGEDCSDAFYCAPGETYCDGSTCVPLPGMGEPCGAQVGQRPRLCAAGFGCDDTSDPPTCVSLPSAGEPCDEGCLAGFECACDGQPPCSDRTCKRLVDPGGSCAAASDLCLASSCTNGVCTEAVGPSVFETVCGAR